VQHEHLAGGGTREVLIRGQHQCGYTAGADDSLEICSKARRFLRDKRRVGMLGQQDARIHGQGAADPQTQTAERWQDTALEVVRK